MHNHALNSCNAKATTTSSTPIFALMDNSNALQEGWRIVDIKSAGNDKAHNNIQPSLAVYAWRRQA